MTKRPKLRSLSTINSVPIITHKKTSTMTLQVNRILVYSMKFTDDFAINVLQYQSKHDDLPFGKSHP
jgi:hypothetical protein